MKSKAGSTDGLCVSLVRWIDVVGLDHLSCKPLWHVCVFVHGIVCAQIGGEERELMN